MIVAIVLICTVGGLLSTIAVQLRRYAERRHELEFKREMVERGMTIDEIERLAQPRASDD